MPGVISRQRSIVPACDVLTLAELIKLVDQTRDVEGIGAYKLDAMSCVGPRGMEIVAEVLGALTDLPFIYDHQKAGNDIPDLGGIFGQNVNMVKAAIIFPFAGPATQEAWIKAVQDEGVIPVVGGEMTHPKFMVADGGYIADDAPRRIFELATELGVRDFVVPGNKPEKVQAYRKLLEGLCGDDPISLYAPGFVAQGGVIKEAAQVAGESWHAIVGRGIYQAGDMHAAAVEHCSQIIAA